MSTKLGNELSRSGHDPELNFVFKYWYDAAQKI